MKLIWKLLRQHISLGQLAGFFLANLLGMVIVLLGVQFYNDALPLFTQGNSFMKEEYLVVSKEVSAFRSLAGSNQFSEKEIKELQAQPFAKRVGVFTPSQFQVSIQLDISGGMSGLSTDMFFESVPDHFIDIPLDKWVFNPQEKTIPIVIPRNYLNLYNFGFSQSYNLPQLTESTMSLVPLDIIIWGRSGRKVFKGSIVGFSDRINTILVPEKFMQWANDSFGEEKSQQPSRLIVEVGNPADKAIASYFQDKRYEVESDKLDAGKTAYFLRLIVGIVLAIGLFISLLSFYILILSIFLLLEKNSTKLENLLLIGYSPAQVARPYQWLTTILNSGILLLSLSLVGMAQHIYSDILITLFPQLEVNSLLPSIIVGTVLFLLISFINSKVIRRKVNSIWFHK